MKRKKLHNGRGERLLNIFEGKWRGGKPEKRKSLYIREEEGNKGERKGPPKEV